MEKEFEKEWIHVYVGPYHFHVPLELTQLNQLWVLGCSVVSDSAGPMDCSPPSSSASGISQAKILEWVAISYSKASSRPRDQTCVS